MTIKEVRAMAKRMGLRIGRSRKAGLIVSIQNAEGNTPCFGTERVQYCGEEGCLWRDDCLEVTGV